MYKDLPAGTKRSITLSVKKCFADYMSNIRWKEGLYSSDDFMKYWIDYSRKHAAWFKDVEKELSMNPTFQKELTDKVNGIIQQIIETPPTEDQMAEIDKLAKEQKKKDPEYCCKLEADFVIGSMKA